MTTSPHLRAPSSSVVSRRWLLPASVALGLTITFIGATSHRMKPHSSVVLPATTPSLAAAPLPTPTPRPKVDPYNGQQKVPSWAQGRPVHRVPVKPGSKVIALTFDDGPWPHSTRQILSILAQHKIKATFFMIGSVVQEYPQIARSVRDAGHSIGNHSWSHPLRPRDARAQIDRTDAIIKRTVGITPTIYRPPYGALKNGMDKRATQLHKAIIIWSDDSDDWRRPPASRLASTVLREASSGGIVLMHDGGGPRSHTVQALPIIISHLQQRGYRFVTVPELLRLRYIAPRPTVKPIKKPAKVKKSTKYKTAAR
jgi:chitin deacetylase